VTTERKEPRMPDDRHGPAAGLDTALAEIKRVIVGQERLLERALVALLARDVLRHRLVLTYQALAEDVTADKLLDAVLEAVPAPRIELAREASA